MRRVFLPLAAVLLMLMPSGCDQQTSKPASGTDPAEKAVTADPKTLDNRQPSESSDPGVSAGEAPQITTEEELKAALKAKNPEFGGELGTNQGGPKITLLEIHDPGIEDISPLAGLPLQGLDLSGCHVTDISALEGMPLSVLYLEETGVKDIGVLKGMPLTQLYLSNTKVEDISALEGAPLENLNLLGTRVTDLKPISHSAIKMLWLNETPVSDISPLATVPLESLTLAGTKVSDLSPLKDHRLLRLHIADSEVTDLSALERMHLTRLVFTPGNIETGIEHARNMPSLREIGTSFEGNRLPPPPVFWQQYDAGEFD